MIAAYAMPDAVHAYGISIAAYAALLPMSKGARHGSRFLTRKIPRI